MGIPIAPDYIVEGTGGDDLFVHYSYVNMDGYKSLKAGQFVQFDIQASGNGFHAVNLVPLQESEGQMRASDRDETPSRSPALPVYN